MSSAQQAPAASTELQGYENPNDFYYVENHTSPCRRTQSLPLVLIDKDEEPIYNSPCPNPDEPTAAEVTFKMPVLPTYQAEKDTLMRAGKTQLRNK